MRLGQILTSAAVISILGTSCIKSEVKLGKIVSARAKTARIETDKTKEALAEYASDWNLKEDNSFTVNNVRVHVYTSAYSDKLFAGHTQKYYDLKMQIEQTMKSALLHYDTFSDFAAKDLHLLLIKAAFAEARIGSSIIELDTRWFYRLFAKGHDVYAEAVLAHEHAHVQNYVFDPKEYKRDREFAAILFETASFLKNGNVEKYLERYSPTFGYAFDPESIVKMDAPMQKNRRALARYLVNSLAKKEYKSHYPVRKTLELLAAAYLTDPLISDGGFNHAAKFVGIKRAGSPLTMHMLKRDAAKLGKITVPSTIKDGFEDADACFYENLDAVLEREEGKLARPDD